MRRSRQGPSNFQGLDLSTAKVFMDHGAAQKSENVDYRRNAAARVRPGYARMLATSLIWSNTSVDTDDFNRANGALGAEWDTGYAPSDFVIASNQARHENAAAALGANGFIGSSFGNDQYAKATVAALPINATCGVMVRATTGGGGYAFYVFNFGGSGWVVLLKIFSWNAGLGPTTQALLAAQYTASVGDVVELRAVGTTLYGYINGVLLAEAEDSAWVSGKPGLIADNFGTPTRGELDTFDAGTASKTFPAAKVTGEPSALFAFERDDDNVKVMLAYDTKLDEFDAGEAEWTT